MTDNRSISTLINNFSNRAKYYGNKTVNWMTDNPVKTAAAVAALTALTNKDESKVKPLLAGGITYALFGLLPKIMGTTNSLVDKANYTALEAQALMAKGNYLADTVPSAPLLFGRKKHMQKIQQDAIRKSNEVFYNAYQKYRQQGKLTSNYTIDQIDRIKDELKGMA